MNPIMRMLTLGCPWFTGVRLSAKAVVIGAVALAFGTAHGRAGRHQRLDQRTGRMVRRYPALAIDPTTPSTLYAGTVPWDGGVFQSTNSGGQLERSQHRPDAVLASSSRWPSTRPRRARSTPGPMGASSRAPTAAAAGARQHRR